MTWLDYTNRPINSPSGTGTHRRWKSILAAAAIVTVPTIFLCCYTFQRRIKSVSPNDALRELQFNFGSRCAPVSSVQAAVLSGKLIRDDYSHDSDQCWWYRFSVAPDAAEAFVADLQSAWISRQPQPWEGVNHRMPEKNRPCYIVVDGNKAQEIFNADYGDTPNWWRPEEIPDLKYIVFADTDGQFSGLHPSTPFNRFQLAYSKRTGTFYMREFRPYSRYTLVTPPQSMPATAKAQPPGK